MNVPTQSSDAVTGPTAGRAAALTDQIRLYFMFHL